MLAKNMSTICFRNCVFAIFLISTSLSLYSVEEIQLIQKDKSIASLQDFIFDQAKSTCNIKRHKLFCLVGKIIQPTSDKEWDEITCLDVKDVGLDSFLPRELIILGVAISKLKNLKEVDISGNSIGFIEDNKLSYLESLIFVYCKKCDVVFSKGGEKLGETSLFMRANAQNRDFDMLKKLGFKEMDDAWIKPKESIFEKASDCAKQTIKTCKIM
jgi:Leucine-rich repeat (LRR) protein